MNSVIELKTSIKSFDNAITDEAFNSFAKALMQIWQHYENTASVITLIKMMQALGKYLRTKKESAHADALPLLKAISDNLEKIIDTPYLEDNEIDKILNDQLREYKLFQGMVTSKPVISPKDIDSLKAVILAIDWEISDTTLQNFDTVVAQLISKFEKYKIHHAFLRIIYSTGKYIGAQKANAPADSISFLRSIFEHFNDIVQSENMPFNDKKQLLENDIKRFQEFKQGISKQKKRKKPGQEAAETDEPDIMPALSHVKASSSSSDDVFMPLTELPDEEGNSLYQENMDEQGLEPALANAEPGSETPHDVMDDLFSVKESPADELLDAIHLMEVHGEKGQDHAMKMLDQADDGQAGLKTFTPEKKDTTPIQEIGDRLDEFFSLDTPEQTSDENIEIGEITADETEQFSGLPANSADSIIPFGAEDEAFEETVTIEDSGETPDQEAHDQALLDQLQLSLQSKEYLQDDNALQAIQQNIQELKTHWKNKPKKLSLLEMITSSIDLPEGKGLTDGVSETDEYSESNIDGEVSSKQISPGIWGKIKSMFTR